MKVSDRFYLLQPDDDWGRQHPYELRAARDLYLPGMRCHACRATWATTGAQYPTIDADALRSRLAGVGRAPVDVVEFRALARDVGEIVGTGVPLYPGTEFGPLHGSFSGALTEFLWVNPWTPLMLRPALERLPVLAPALRFAAAQISGLPEGVGPLVELEAAPTGRLAVAGAGEQATNECATCGRPFGQVPAEIVLAGADLDRQGSLFRLSRFPTVLIARGAFADAIRRLGLANVKLREIAVRD